MTNRNFEYPYARPETLYDYFYSHIIHDPYRWMEEADSEETQAYIAAQNELTNAFISEIPAREVIHQRLTELADYEKWSDVRKKEGKLFYWHNDGLQNQAKYYYREDRTDASPTLLLDPNTLSDDGTVAVNITSISPDASHLAYTVSVHGSDWQAIRIRRIADQTDLEETLEHCKFASIAWAKDGSGFYYDRYPAKGSVKPKDESRFNAVYWHSLNSAQSEDLKIYDRPRSKDLGFRTHITDDGLFHIFHVWHGAISRNRLYYRLKGDDGEFGPVIQLIDKADAYFNVIGTLSKDDGHTLIVQTDHKAPRGRVILINTAQPNRNWWRELIPEGEQVINAARIIHNKLVLQVTQDVVSKLNIYDLEGNMEREVALPGLGTVVNLTGDRADDEMFFSFQSFLLPPSTFRYRFEDNSLKPLFVPQVALDLTQFTAEQRFYTSKDGTRIPIFLVYKKGLERTGDHPTMLYGYGGFSISLTPAFSSVNLQWVEMGGVYAVANLRGGNEYGDAWHKAGMLTNKQNVFDDFISAGEWLIKQGFTSKKRLAIHGRSNGGLLVAACLLQRPDLFGAALCGVPVIDMLRYHLFTAGRYWVPEYGDPAKRSHFDAMIAYSPLHNIKEGASYPPLLVYTAEVDDRVVPMHSLKFIATIQKGDSGNNPLLLRMDTKSGHGLGKPISKVIDEYADLYAFLFQMLEMDLLS